MATIENFATVSYTSGGISASKTSNLAEIELNSSLSFSKVALGTSYTSDAPITYIISITNSSTAAVSGISVSDDLGTFTSDTLQLTPLDYVGPALLLINGQDASSLLSVDSSSASSLVFSITSLPASSTANIVYKAQPNSFAPLSSGSLITNTASLTSDSDCADGSATATVSAEDSARIEVVKSMSPNPVVCGEAITYSIRVYNYGNIDAEDVVLYDTFNPAPTTITVSRNGISLLNSEFTYVDGLLTVPSTSGDTVPAAVFTRDATSGEITLSPGMVEYVVTGII